MKLKNEETKQKKEKNEEKKKETTKDKDDVYDDTLLTKFNINDCSKINHKYSTKPFKLRDLNALKFWNYTDVVHEIEYIRKAKLQVSDGSFIYQLLAPIKEVKFWENDNLFGSDLLWGKYDDCDQYLKPFDGRKCSKEIRNIISTDNQLYGFMRLKNELEAMKFIFKDFESNKYIQWLKGYFEWLKTPEIDYYDYFLESAKNVELKTFQDSLLMKRIRILINAAWLSYEEFATQQVLEEMVRFSFHDPYSLDINSWISDIRQHFFHKSGGYGYFFDTTLQGTTIGYHVGKFERGTEILYYVDREKINKVLSDMGKAGFTSTVIYLRSMMEDVLTPNNAHKLGEIIFINMCGYVKGRPDFVLYKSMDKANLSYKELKERSLLLDKTWLPEFQLELKKYYSDLTLKCSKELEGIDYYGYILKVWQCMTNMSPGGNSDVFLILTESEMKKLHIDSNSEFGRKLKEGIKLRSKKTAFLAYIKELLNWEVMKEVGGDKNPLTKGNRVIQQGRMRTMFVMDLQFALMDCIWQLMYGDLLTKDGHFMFGGEGQNLFSNHPRMSCHSFYDMFVCSDISHCDQSQKFEIVFSSIITGVLDSIRSNNIKLQPIFEHKGEPITLVDMLECALTRLGHIRLFNSKKRIVKKYMWKDNIVGGKLIPWVKGFPRAYTIPQMSKKEFTELVYPYTLSILPSGMSLTAIINSVTVYCAHLMFFKRLSELAAKCPSDIKWIPLTKLEFNQVFGRLVRNGEMTDEVYYKGLGDDGLLHFLLRDLSPVLWQKVILFIRGAFVHATRMCSLNTNAQKLLVKWYEFLKKYSLNGMFIHRTYQLSKNETETPKSDLSLTNQIETVRSRMMDCIGRGQLLVCIEFYYYYCATRVFYECDVKLKDFMLNQLKPLILKSKLNIAIPEFSLVTRKVEINEKRKFKHQMVIKTKFFPTVGELIFMCQLQPNTIMGAQVKTIIAYDLTNTKFGRMPLLMEKLYKLSGSVRDKIAKLIKNKNFFIQGESELSRAIATHKNFAQSVKAYDALPDRFKHPEISLKYFGENAAINAINGLDKISALTHYEGSQVVKNYFKQLIKLFKNYTGEKKVKVLIVNPIHYDTAIGCLRLHSKYVALHNYQDVEKLLGLTPVDVQISKDEPIEASLGSLVQLAISNSRTENILLNMVTFSLTDIAVEKDDACSGMPIVNNNSVLNLLLEHITVGSGNMHIPDGLTKIQRTLVKAGLLADIRVEKLMEILCEPGLTSKYQKMIMLSAGVDSSVGEAFVDNLSKYKMALAFAGLNKEYSTNDSITSYIRMDRKNISRFIIIENSSLMPESLVNSLLHYSFSYYLSRPFQADGYHAFFSVSKGCFQKLKVHVNIELVYRVLLVNGLKGTDSLQTVMSMLL